MKKNTHYLEYLGARFLSTIAAALPLSLARKIGRGLGWFVYKYVKTRRKNIIQNMTMVFPEKSASEIEQLALANYKMFGMMAMEYLRVPALTPEKLHQIIPFKGMEKIEAAKAQGKGVILLMSHFGNWEYLAGRLSSDHHVSFMYREQKNKYIDGMIAAYREKMNMKMVPKQAGGRGFIRALKNGECVCLLADQDAGRHGIFVDFLGHPASTAIGISRFVIRSGAPVLFMACVRDAQYNLSVTIEEMAIPPLTGDADTDEFAIMKCYNDTVSDWIRRYPDHWFWMHRRWMTKEKKEK